MDSGPGKGLVTVAFGRIQKARAFWGPHSKDQNILGHVKGARFWEPPYVVPNSHGEPYCVAMIPRPRHRPLSATIDHRFMCRRVRRFGVTKLVQLQWTDVLNGHFWGLDVSLGEGMFAALFPLYMASRCKQHTSHHVTMLSSVCPLVLAVNPLVAADSKTFYEP